MPTVGDLAATSPLVTGIAGTQKPLLGGNFGLDVSGGLVGEVDDAVTDGLGAEEAHGLLVAGLAEKAHSGPEHVAHLAPALITTSLQSLVLATEAGSGSWCCVLGGRPGSKSASARPIAASAAQAAKADW